MPGGLGPFEPTSPWQPGAEYLKILSTPVVGLTQDDAIVYLDLQVYVTEEFPYVYLDIQPSAAVEAEHSVDSATVYVDLTLTGGECYSSSSGLNLEADAMEQFKGEPYQRWIAEDSTAQFMVTDDPFLQFVALDELRWQIIGISTDQGC